MSSRPQDATNTPNRKTSASALFGAFRTLTGGRLRYPLGSSSNLPTGAATTSESSTNSHVAPATWSQNIAHRTNGDVSANAAGPASQAPALEPGIGVDAVIGGPAELTDLLEQLNRKYSIQDRIAAAERIGPLLLEYPVNHILPIWTLASDMLNQEDSPEAQRAAYTLLAHCVQLSTLTTTERTLFFDAIASKKTYENFDLRFKALVSLTNGGRNVEAIESELVSLLISSLNLSFAAVREARRERRKTKSKTSSTEDASFFELFQYIIDATRFNSKLFQEDDLELLLKQIVGICKETTEQSDIQRSIELFHALITYTHIPADSLRSCVEVLCDVHRQLQELREQTWRALGDLLKSHMGQSAVSAIFNILQDTATPKPQTDNTTRGAIHAGQKLLLLDGEDGFPSISLSQFLAELKVATRSSSRKIRIDALKFLVILVSDERLQPRLLEEKDWSDFIELIETCVDQQQVFSSGEPKIRSESHSPQNGDGRDRRSSKDSDSGSIDKYLNQLVLSLTNILDRTDFSQRSALMDLYMRLGIRLPDDAADSLVAFQTEERLLYPSHEPWLINCRNLLDKFFKDFSRPAGLRIKILGFLRDCYDTVDGVYDAQAVTEYADEILKNITTEKDVVVLNELVDFAVQTTDVCDDKQFSRIMSLMDSVVTSSRSHVHASPAIQGLRDSSVDKTEEMLDLGSAGNVASLGIVRIFMRMLHKSYSRSTEVYTILLRIVSSEDYETDARVTALKCLFRLRSDSRHAILISSSSEGQSIASVLYRTAGAEVPKDRNETSSPTDQPSKDENGASRESTSTANLNKHTSMTRRSLRTANSSGRLNKPVRPLWMYPGPRGLPEEPSIQASKLVFSHLNELETIEGISIGSLKIALWLELIISILQNGADWEVFSYIVVHLGSQLTNQTLFRDCIPQIKLLRNVLCDQIRMGSFAEPPGFTSLRRGDVAVCLYHTLTVLVGYHAHFEKSEEDDIVRMFIIGVGNWGTTKWCIHALFLCCHELPLSTSKNLDSIIQKMAQIVTQPHLAVHILEFLTAVSRLPELYKNFREEDFKMVFGVSFRYLQYVRDQRERISYGNSSKGGSSGYPALRNSGPSREFGLASEQDTKLSNRSTAEDLPHYVLALAYHVIAFWFLCLKIQERRNLMAWITQNLVYVDRSGREIVEDEALVTIDLMQRVAYSDRDETIPPEKFAEESDGEVSKKTWLVGYSILTIETAGRTGLSLVTSRRPSGTRYLVFRPLLTNPPRHQVPITAGVAAEAFYTSAYIGILPDDVLQTFYSPFEFPGSHGMITEEPIPLPDDDAIRRAISVFDRDLTVDGHKIGVIYVGEKQTDEKTILNNVMGSADYTKFLDGLGTLTRLKNAKFNTGGLDTSFDSDGEFTYCWRDRVTEIVFHVTTLMPTDPGNSECFANKKRHIGNDFVNIVFNNSGLPYDFDTFASAFNYVVILITPESRISFVDTRLENDPFGDNRFYKVQVLSRPGFPEISPAAERKVISGRHLASYVRLVALNANVFSQVWSIRGEGESLSPWRNRLRGIRALRERHGATPGPEKRHQLQHQQHSAQQTSSSVAPTPTSATVPSGGRESYPGMSTRDSGLGFKRTSVATLFSEGTSRSSGVSGGADMERQVSEGSRL